MVGEERFYGLILLLAHVQLCDDFCKTQFFSAIARLKFKFTDHKHFYNIEHHNILFLAFDSPDRGLNVMATSNSITLI